MKAKSLGTRVIIATLASSALGGAIAAIAAVVFVDQLGKSRGDTRLMGAAKILEGEILEDFEEEWEPLAAVVDDENGELVTSGIRLAVYSSGHRIAGDPWVPEASAGECQSFGSLGQRIRACGHGFRRWVLVAASESDEASLRITYLVASLSALLLGGLAGALAASRMSLWALRPLHALSAELRTMRAEEPKPAPSTRAEDEPLEVAQIRAALTDLLARIALLLDPARRFAVDAAHELRTPLTTIRGELDLLIEDTTDAKARAGLERVSEHLLHLSELVERLLLLALPLAEERTSDETVALSDVIEEVIGRLPSALRARVRTASEVEGLVRGEPRLLAALVRNALDNALKYSEGAVEVTLREGERSVVIEVSDRGPGIAKELRERVFEPFVRLGRRDAQGHGLGLPLIAHLVRAHGGTVAFVEPSQPDDRQPPRAPGACLRIELPRWQPRGALNHS